MKTKNQTVKYRSITGSAAYGVVAAVIAGLLMSAFAAFFLSQGSIAMESLGIVTGVIWFCTSFLGCVTAMRMASNKYLLTGGITAAGIMFVVFGANMLTGDSSFSGAWKAMLFLAAGLLGACAICISKAGKNKSRKYHPR